MVLAIGSLGVALASQHLAGMEPCPWCVMQRIAYLLVAIFAAVALPLRRFPRAARLPLGLALVAAVGGLGSALYQHFVAAVAGSCAYTAPQRFLVWSGLDYQMPWFFAATAPCDEADAPLLGIPYSHWSAALAVLLIGLLIAALHQTRRR